MMTLSRLRIALLIAAILAPQAARAQSTELAPGLVVHATAAGNVVTFAGPEGAFVVGPVTAASTPVIQADLARRTSSPMRYVIAMVSDQSAADGDGGWVRSGAFVATHEAAFGRFAAGSRPRAAFSEVLKFWIGNESIHAVHQPPGHDAADVLVHFERSRVVYLGELLPGDGYPVIDAEHGGNIDSLILALSPWVHNPNRFVPARGPVVPDSAVSDLMTALLMTRDRVKLMKQAGQTIDQVVAAHPSRDYDPRFGHGRVTPDQFVRAVYQTVSAH